eukprot:7558518-Pyramimonas_sp.AAC.1
MSAGVRGRCGPPKRCPSARAVSERGGGTTRRPISAAISWQPTRAPTRSRWRRCCPGHASWNSPLRTDWSCQPRAWFL